MYTNVGRNERTVRVLLGLIILIGTYLMPSYGYLTYFLYVIGSLSFLTGFFGVCFIYSIFNYSSKGTGIDHVTKNDIQNAIRNRKVDHSNSTHSHKIRTVDLSELHKEKQKALHKKSTKKKVSKKKIVKKSTPSKKIQKKDVKIVAPKKKVVKKMPDKKKIEKKSTTAKISKNKASSKKTVVKKKAVKKNTTSKKSSVKKTANKKKIISKKK